MFQDLEIIYSEDSSCIDFSDLEFANLFLVDLVINKENIACIFDTGATRTVLSETVANHIGSILLPEKLEGAGNTGKKFLTQLRNVSELKIGNHSIRDLNILVVPDEYLDFGYDEKGNHLKVNGLLGWDVISNFKWTINPIQRTFVIEKPKHSLRAQSLSWDNMPIIDVKYNGTKMKLGFDSGHTESMLGKNFIPFLDNKQEKIDEFSGVGDTKDEAVYFVKNIEFLISGKKIYLEDLSVFKRDLFPTKEDSVMGLLGVDIIQNHICIIDNLNRNFELLKSF